MTNPKLLCAIMTCFRLDYWIDDQTQDWLASRGMRQTDQQARVNTIRETWIKDLKSFDIPYKFFYGKRLRSSNERRVNPALNKLRDPLPDEEFLDCGDNYTQNPAKMKAICRYALDHGYDYILRCDDDTFVYPDRLLKEDWATKDYSGANASEFHPGGCMFLSARLMRLIVDAPITTYADDIWIGQIAQDNRIPVTQISSMYNHFGDAYKVPISIDPTGLSSLHSCTPSVMRRLYEQR